MTTATAAATHTPGPWRVHSETLVIHGDDSRTATSISYSADDRSQVFANHRVPGEAAANARLIAAAPELLAALQAGVDNEIGMTDWLRMARAAIAKATGEA